MRFINFRPVTRSRRRRRTADTADTAETAAERQRQSEHRYRETHSGTRVHALTNRAVNRATVYLYTYTHACARTRDPQVCVVSCKLTVLAATVAAAAADGDRARGD